MIGDILHQIFGFNYASNLEPNMGYLSMPLDCEARKILTLVTTFGLLVFSLTSRNKTGDGHFSRKNDWLFVDMKRPP